MLQKAARGHCRAAAAAEAAAADCKASRPPFPFPLPPHSHHTAVTSLHSPHAAAAATGDGDHESRFTMTRASESCGVRRRGSRRTADWAGACRRQGGLQKKDREVTRISFLTASPYFKKDHYISSCHHLNLFLFPIRK